MAKIFFHTYDTFDIKDEKTKWNYFDYCRKQALNSGLRCKCFIEEPVLMLELWGSKSQFVKYYFKTILKCQSRVKGIRRLVSFLVEKSKGS